MIIHKKQIIDLIKTNRKVYNKQYDYNTFEMLKHIVTDKIFVVCSSVLLVLLCRESFLMTGVIILLSLYLLCLTYYGVRDSWYKALVKSEINSIAEWQQVLRGSIHTLYINSKDVSLIYEIQNFILNDAGFSKIINKHLSRRFRSKGDRFWFKKNEKWIIETIQNKFSIEVFIGKKGEQEMVYLYTDSKVIPTFNVTRIYNDFERLKELPTSKFDLAWFLCRLLTLVLLIASVYTIMLLLR